MTPELQTLIGYGLIAFLVSAGIGVCAFLANSSFLIEITRSRQIDMDSTVSAAKGDSQSPAKNL
jgi:hypothetical protein